MFQDIDMEETFSLKSTGALLGYDVKRDNSVGGVDNKQIIVLCFQPSILAQVQKWIPEPKQHLALGGGPYLCSKVIFLRNC